MIRGAALAALVGLVVWFGWAAQHTEASGVGGPLVVPEDIPERTFEAYLSAVRQAPAGCGLTWPVLAGFGAVESGHGTYSGDGVTRSIGPDGVVSPPIIGPRLDGGRFARILDTDGGRWDGDTVFDRAVGPTQFIPSTWRGVMGGEGDPQDVDDAAVATARKVCHDAGGPITVPANFTRAVYRYNPSREYVRAVGERVEGYERWAARHPGAEAQAPSSSRVDELTLSDIARTMGESGKRQWGRVGDVLGRDGADGYLDYGYGLVDPAVMGVLDTLAPPTGERVEAPARSSSGRWAFPVPAGVVTRGDVAGPHHDYPAVDLSTPSGTPVLAPEAGRVVAVDNGGCGYGVAIEGDSGLRWGLCHFQAPTELATGARVEAGDEVGRSGNTGRSTGPHLHVQVQRQGGALFCPQPALLAWMSGDLDRAPSPGDGTDCSY